MQQYGLSFGFREPYQVLGIFPQRIQSPSKQLLILWLTVDADMIKDADRFKMDLVGGLERTLQGQVKPSPSPPQLVSVQ